MEQLKAAVSALIIGALSYLLILFAALFLSYYFLVFFKFISSLIGVSELAYFKITFTHVLLVAIFTAIGQPGTTKIPSHLERWISNQLETHFSKLDYANDRLDDIKDEVNSIYHKLDD